MFYSQADQIYTCIQAILTRIQQEAPAEIEAIIASKLIVRLRCTEPDAQITLNGRRHSLQATYGRTPLRPHLDVELTGDTLHRILLGELSLKKALSSKLMKVRGPIWKAFALAGFFQKGQAFYPQVLREQGLEL